MDWKTYTHPFELGFTHYSTSETQPTTAPEQETLAQQTARAVLDHFAEQDASRPAVRDASEAVAVVLRARKLEDGMVHPGGLHKGDNILGSVEPQT